ncbi:MAG: hypothetical protein WCD18_00720 [Thermosynechococcaceae cyanobacterium]
MHTSFIYGLVVQSELPLLDPIPSNREPEVTVRFGSLAHIAVEPDTRHSILIKLPLEVKFLIRNGCHILIDAPPTVDRAIPRTHILGAAMAFILRQRGFLVLHASCVARNDQAIAFLGGSGWGKSTLASWFHQQGYRLMTDDVMAIRMDTSGAQVIPSFPEVKLLPDAAAVLETASESLPLLHSLSHKQIRRLDGQFALHPVPIQQLYVLRAGSYTDIEPISRAQSFTELVQHSRAAKMLGDPTVMIQHFHQCSQLAKTVPMAYLKRPRSLQQLSQVLACVEKHLQIHPPYAEIGDRH